MCFSLTLFSQNVQKTKQQDSLIHHLNASYKVLIHAQEAIRKYVNGKIYLDKSHVYETDKGSFLALDTGEMLLLPFMPQDEQGAYLIGLGMVDSKAFKCHCNSCGYEWEGGVFTFQCESCGSTDFSVIPNW